MSILDTTNSVSAKMSTCYTTNSVSAKMSTCDTTNSVSAKMSICYTINSRCLYDTPPASFSQTCLHVKKTCVPLGADGQCAVGNYYDTAKKKWGYRPQCHGAAMPQILYATSELRLWVSVFFLSISKQHRSFSSKAIENSFGSGALRTEIKGPSCSSNYRKSSLLFFKL